METHFCEYADAHLHLASINRRVNACRTMLCARSRQRVPSVIDILVELSDLQEAASIIAEAAGACAYMATELATTSIPNDIDYLAETARTRLPLHVLEDVVDRGARVVRRDMRRAVGRFGA